MKIKPTHRKGEVLVQLGPQEAQLPEALSGKAAAALPVFTLKKILVPIDFSESSRKALRYAIPFARQFGAEVTLLHVVQPYPPVPEMAPVDVDMIQDAEQELKAFQPELEKAVDSHLLVRVGTPHLAIIEAAKNLEIDLIILSTHGRTGLAHVLLGSTAEKVVRHATCPILVVREDEREFVRGGKTSEG